MMERDEMIRVMEDIIAMQHSRQFALVSFHVTPEEGERLLPALEKDDLSTGAIGRYLDVPVFAVQRLPAEFDYLRAEVANFGGVGYSYVKLAVMD